MKPMDCLLFLVGGRGAILRIAACRNAVWGGFFFVFVAAFAREYDQEYLLAEPWYLLIPPGASFVVATMLFGMLKSVSGREIAWRGYFRQFLSLFWMTAPLAWFYAIPYEQFLDERTAAVANLWTLLLVSVWRVLLIVRVTSVLFDTKCEQVTPPILLVSDTIMLIGLQFVPFPLIQLMGGGGGGAEDVLADAGCCALGLGIVSWPVWALMTGVASGARRKKQIRWAKPPSFDPDVAVNRSTWWVGIVPLLLGVVPIYHAQVVQRGTYLQEQRSNAQPSEATQAAMRMFSDLQYLWWQGPSEQRVELAAQFADWLPDNGEQWVVNHTDERVNAMLGQMRRYADALAAAPELVEYLRKNEATLRPGIDRELLAEIFEMQRATSLTIEGTKAGLRLLRTLNRLSFLADAPQQRAAAAAEFTTWLQEHGAQWVANQPSNRVNDMLRMIEAYASVKSATPDFLEYLRHNEATLRDGIDRELVAQILQ